MLSQVNRLSVLKEATIFSRLDPQVLIQIASMMEEVVFPAHQTIFDKGEAGTDLYILVSGRVRIHVRDLELTQLEPGACFGEMSLFDAQPRSASATTLLPSQCLVFTQTQLEQAIAQTPEISLKLLRLLAARIRKLNRMIGSAEEVSPPIERLLFLPL